MGLFKIPKRSAFIKLNLDIFVLDRNEPELRLG